PRAETIGPDPGNAIHAEAASAASGNVKNGIVLSRGCLFLHGELS
ncbi:MAG: hypothetical protein JWN02_1880, partial [Acidobacteria bacterium]|nr:hypothetical protein [Acidobacteriota bacterium]